MVPTEHNLRPSYGSSGNSSRPAIEDCERVNAREHRGAKRRPPAVMLAEERVRPDPLPAVAHTICFGQTRRLSWQSTISVGGALYSVP